MVQNPRPRGACTFAHWSSSAPSFRPGMCKITLLKIAGLVLAQACMTKENVKNVGKERTWTDQKRVCARPKRGGRGGLLNNLSSEGRERRRRRAEDVGVVLGEAARVRDVGLFTRASAAARRRPSPRNRRSGWALVEVTCGGVRGLAAAARVDGVARYAIFRALWLQVAPEQFRRYEGSAAPLPPRVRSHGGA